MALRAWSKIMVGVRVRLGFGYGVRERVISTGVMISIVTTKLVMISIVIVSIWATGRMRERINIGLI